MRSVPRRRGDGGGEVDAMRDIRMSKGARCGRDIELEVVLLESGMVVEVRGIVCGAMEESLSGQMGIEYQEENESKIPFRQGGKIHSWLTCLRPRH
jgi:hypothetical protein